MASDRDRLGSGCFGAIRRYMYWRPRVLLPIIATASHTPSGWYGFTLGPPILRTSSPLVARA